MAKRSRKYMYVKRYLERDNIDFVCDYEPNEIHNDSLIAHTCTVSSDSSHCSSISIDSTDSNNLSLENIDSVSLVDTIVDTDINRSDLTSYTDDPGCSTFNLSNHEPLKNKLRNWALTENINHKQLNKLLTILKPYHTDLPADSRSLLGTPRSLNTISMLSIKNTEGQYIYLGIKENLEQQLLYGNLNCILNARNIESIELKCNIDGLKIHKSTNIDFWPILGTVHIENMKTNPFVIAIYMGDSKPQLNKYLKEFIDEIKLLTLSGIKCEQKEYKFLLKYIVCDAPARAFLKSIKSHGGYYACERCNVKGIKQRHMVYPVSNNEEKRTHETFINQAHEDHHINISPLIEIENFDMIYGFPLDYMHLACLGTTRRLLNFWFKPDSQFRVTPSLRKEASSRILAIRSHVPREFNRRPRSFNELDRWKATEFRFFLLYIGVYIMHGIISTEQYRHFVHFVCAMRIVCSKEFLSNFGNVAITVADTCCKNFEKLYTPEEPVFNTHSLLHLIHDAVERNENPEDINCFMFENYLGQLKKMLRTPNLPLQQVCKRLAERKKICNPMYDSINNADCLVVSEECGIIKAVKYKGLYIATHPEQESYIIVCNKKIMKVKQILRNEDDGIQFNGPIFLTTDNQFNTPIPSSCLNMFKVCNLSEFQYSISPKDIVTKCMVFPLHDSEHLCAIGLLHL